MNKRIIFTAFTFFLLLNLHSQETDLYKPENGAPGKISGMTLVWNDEFNIDGKPDSSAWRYEKGFVRNNELQWYTSENAVCKGGVLVIEGKKEKLQNPGYRQGSTDWRTSREYIEYTSSSIQTRGKKQWMYGRFEIRARIDTALGAWPAIWTLGVEKQWPSNGEIDIMEFYRINGVPTILANFAWGTSERWKAKWDDAKPPLADFTKNDRDWVKKFHIWSMDWDENSVSILIDGRLVNTVSLSETVNPDGFNPFKQPHYILLNLALGGNGGEPYSDFKTIRYEVDYVRVYQKK
jgi:beta-glucanase (GH16 family)